MAFSVLLLWLCLISEVLHKVTAHKNIGSRTSAHEGSVVSTCTPKEVTLRNAYLALNAVSAQCDILALRLNVKRGVLGNIEMDCHRDNDCKYRRIIEAWYNGRTEPSWDELLNALDEMKEYDTVKKITNELLCSGEDFDKLHAGVSLNGGPKEVMHQLMNEFEQMKNSFELYLLLHPPDLEMFKRCIVRILHQPNFFAEDQHQFHLPKGLMDDDMNIINKAVTAGKILTHFHTHMWNFLEYELFEAFAIKFGSIELQKQLQKYSVQVSEFRRVTTISEFLQIWSKQSIPPSGFITYTVKFEENSHEMTLEKVQKLRIMQAKSCSLPIYAFRFASGLTNENEGCVTITWFVKSAVALEIQQTMANNPDSFVVDLLYLKVGDTMIFDYLNIQHLVYATLSLLLVTGISVFSLYMFLTFDLFFEETGKYIQKLEASAISPNVVSNTIAILSFVIMAVLSDLKSTTIGVMVGAHTGLIVGLVATALSKEIPSGSLAPPESWETTLSDFIVGPVTGAFVGQHVGIMAGATGDITSGFTIVVLITLTVCVGFEFFLNPGYRTPMIITVTVTLSIEAFGAVLFYMIANKFVMVIVKNQLLAVITRVVIVFGSLSGTPLYLSIVNSLSCSSKWLEQPLIMLLLICETMIGITIFDASIIQVAVLFPGLAIINSIVNNHWTSLRKVEWASWLKWF